MNLKKILILSLISIFFFIIGGEFHYREIFPYGGGIRNKLTFLKKPKIIKNKLCSNLKYRKIEFEFFLDKVSSGGKIDYLIIGDSVADGAHSPKLFNIKYDIIATDAATVGCLENFIDYVIQINPKNLIIYLGGNDADGQGIQNFTEASKTYLKFIMNFHKYNSNSKIYALGVNIGVPWRRDNNFAKNFNDQIKEGVKKINSENIKYIESFQGLNFKNATKKQIEASRLTYDGEHLKYQGYVNWFKYLNKEIDGGIYTE